ncbi:REP-associated tyrosine transposase [Hymenobacter psychrotolerans]|uniref:Transposase IS200 like n=1 Tax=Hymenobacter psychrotolerans DSM 18569 TaxID=1121959 RepID=A0A1M6T4Y3_9BACT|nr:transposase [Hymenobacter psychrotolerans]SHK52033.1 Transposase IS200 like [Hymenobacter psychrotolerans DSM 18569]
MKTHYERFLPHWLPPGETLFVTFRLNGSLPRRVIAQLLEKRELLRQAPATRLSAAERYREQKQFFARFDAQLDQAAHGPRWLAEPAVAAVVSEALHFRHGKAYELICFCLMPNHVHIVVQLPDDAPDFMRTLQSLKMNTALKANKILEREGQFWQRESYDHIVRDGKELQRIVAYVLENPVKAGLTDNWQDWPYTYWAAEHQ